MARAGQTYIEFNQQYFNAIMRTAGVQSLQQAVAERVLSAAQASAPVDTKAYRNGLRIRKRASRYRDVFLVEGTDPKTLLIESKTGNLARALKSAGRG